MKRSALLIGKLTPLDSTNCLNDFMKQVTSPPPELDAFKTASSLV